MTALVSIFSITFIKFRFTVKLSATNAFLTNYFEYLYSVPLKGPSTASGVPRVQAM